MDGFLSCMELQDLINKLKSEEHIIRIDGPAYKWEELPEVDFSKLNPEELENAKAKIGSMKKFLCDTYLMEDDLSDNQRDGFEQHMAQKYGVTYWELDKRSRLRVNVIMGRGLGPIRTMNRDGLLKEPNERIEAIANEMDRRFYGKYYSMSNPERVQVVDDLTARVFEVLQILSRSPAPQ